MHNVEWKVEGDKLIVTIDISKESVEEAPASASGKCPSENKLSLLNRLATGLLKSGDPLLNPLNLLPLFSPFTELGAPDVDQAESSSL